MREELMRELVTPLLDWYAANRRELPWRNQPTPYQVWISEIMLQQTRVEAVKEHYRRFLRDLPDIKALAEAPEEQLLKLWEGLGYYSRARNLQKAARVIMTQYDGVFPEDPAELKRLPGIGDYTTGAIASIAFGKPEPAVDGNVLRVLSRVLKFDGDIDRPEVKRKFADRLREVYPEGRCADFTQSLMELGAMICIPHGAPKCEACPLKNLCEAHRDQRETELPVRGRKTARQIEFYTILLLRKGKRVAFRKRTKQGLLSGLWEFPNLPGKMNREEVLEYLRTEQVQVSRILQSKEAKHIFTHREWHMNAWAIECANEPSQWKWMSKAEQEQSFSLPSAFKKFLKEAFAEKEDDFFL